MTTRTDRARAALNWLASFKHLSLLAVIPITAHAHWHLAVQLGVPLWLAPLLPVAVDAYVLASFRAWRDQASAATGSRVKVRTPDLLWALVLDAMAVAGSHAAAQFDLTTPGRLAIRAVLAATLGVLLVLTLWRVHALDVRIKPATRTARQTTPIAALEPATAAVATTPAKVVKPQVGPRTTPARSNPTDTVLAVMVPDVDMSMGEIIMATGLARSTAKKAVTELKTAGQLATFGDPAKPRYRLAVATVEAAL